MNGPATNGLKVDTIAAEMVRPSARTSSLGGATIDTQQRLAGSGEHDHESQKQRQGEEQQAYQPPSKNVGRSQSMLDRLSSTAAGSDTDSLAASNDRTIAANMDGASPSLTNAASDLVRRHHTLSTSSSRLVRLERNKARLALQGVGLSEEDQEFYVPPSPVKHTIGWSGTIDASSQVVLHARHSLAAPPPSHGGSNNVSSLDRSNSSGSSVGRGAGGSAWSGSDSTIGAGAADHMSATTQLDSGHIKPTPIATSQPPKRSSFVVVRGGKGDAELTTRKQDAQPAWSATLDQPLTTETSTLKHKNSLKPFLEAEKGENDEEEWEKSLKDERTREEMDLYNKDQYTTPPLPSSATFDNAPFSHSRASTFQPPASTADPWSLNQSGASVRRHQSLNSFKPSAEAGLNMLATSSSADDWASHSRLSSAEELLGPLPTSASFARSRAGTTPAPLSLPHSNHTGHHAALGHSHSLKVGSRPGQAHAGLTHSNSLDRGNFDRGALSPVGGFGPSPWSPTVEESKQLSINGGLGRVNSTSSRSSRLDDEVARVNDDIAQLQVGDSGREPMLVSRPPKTPPGFEAMAGTSDTSPRVIGRSVSNAATQAPRGRLPPLMTDFDGIHSSLDGNMALLARQGPASASPFVPPIGHSHLSGTAGHTLSTLASDSFGVTSEAHPTPTQLSADEWLRQKDTVAANAFPTAVVPSHPLPSEGWPAGGGLGVGIAIQQQQQIQILQNQMQQALTAMDIMRAQGVPVPAGFPALGTGPTLPNGFAAVPPASNGTKQQTLLPAQQIGGPTQTSLPASESSIDVSALIESKGYNPINFDLKPPSARFFVIKSYTEEDVHKSLKYEIWASTDLGNKRLDRAFKESGDKGPIYLFFSVNASGHFAGMAQMLTPVDYQTSSNVWASDKWKGVFKVRWIFIKDVPLAALRHIRLSNTPENKPVTSSRDTQEVPYDAGLEVLRILATYQSRTSLLQDYAWYEARQASGAVDDPSEKRQPHYTRTTASPQPGPYVGPRTASPFASPQQPGNRQQNASPVPFPPRGPGGQQQLSYGHPFMQGPAASHVMGHSGINGLMASPQPPPPQMQPGMNGSSPLQPAPMYHRGPPPAVAGRRFFSGQ
ncbi:hypothetical protein OIV83_001848 [Microbotryomycetes sp. JL201]|nr:hypothetical protein OIV83_001848 [Microbotryomycetes sp. JL201]